MSNSDSEHRKGVKRKLDSQLSEGVKQEVTSKEDNLNVQVSLTHIGVVVTRGCTGLFQVSAFGGFELTRACSLRSHGASTLFAFPGVLNGLSESQRSICNAGGPPCRINQRAI